MTNRLYILLILGSLLTFFFIITKIRKSHMQIRDSIKWIIWTLFLILIASFPRFLPNISNILGIYDDTNTIFLIVVAFIYIVCFLMNSKISQQSEKIKELTQEIALFSKRLTELEQDDKDRKLDK